LTYFMDSLSPTVQLVFQASLPKLAPLPADSPAATPESGQAIAAEFEPAKRFMISTNWVRYVAGGPERPGGGYLFISVHRGHCLKNSIPKNPAFTVLSVFMCCRTASAEHALRELAMRYFKVRYIGPSN
jgi:hypothetical protein